MADVTIRSYRKEREREILNNLEKAMDKVGGIVEKQAAKNIYEHAASTPWKHTGILENAVTHNVINEGNSIVTEIGVGEGEHLNGQKLNKIGKWLELGTPNGRQPPYPWLFPAVESSKNAIIEALKGKFTIE
jgi:hypothetical protein